MRIARLLGCTSILFLAIAATAQQAATPLADGQTIVVKPTLVPDHQAAPAHPATEAQLREYFALTNAARTSHSMMSAVIRGERAVAPPYLPASFWDDMNAEIDKLDIISINIPIYQEYLSQDDLTAILAFYHSPPGKKLLEQQPLIINTAQMIMRGRGEAIGKAVYLRHKDEIDAAKKAYEAQHAPTGSN